MIFFKLSVFSFQFFFSCLDVSHFLFLVCVEFFSFLVFFFHDLICPFFHFSQNRNVLVVWDGMGWVGVGGGWSGGGVGVGRGGRRKGARLSGFIWQTRPARAE